MSDISAIARSGLAAAQTRLGNIANRDSEGYRRMSVDSREAAGGGVIASVRRESEPSGSDGLVTDLVDAMEARQGFAANLKVLKTQDSLIGSLLDVRA
jgi:flagellar hook-associated protein FlgK